MNNSVMEDNREKIFNPDSPYEKSSLISMEAIRQDRLRYMDGAIKQSIRDLSMLIPHYYFERYSIVVVLLKDSPVPDAKCIVAKYIPPKEECSAMSNTDNMRQFFKNWDSILWKNTSACRLCNFFGELQTHLSPSSAD